MFTRDRILLFTALCLLTAAAVYRFRVPNATSPAAGQLEISRIPGPVLSPTRRIEDAATIRFAPDGVTVHGVAAAAFYPVEDDRPDYLRGQNVVAIQKNAALTLRAWLRKRTPEQHGDRWLLHFALWCTVPDQPNPIWWTGWAEVSLSELSVGGLAIVPASGHSIDVLVRTRTGQPIPGASIAVDPAYQQPGFSLQYASTGADGRVTCRGLDGARNWTFSLPMGVGPSRKKVQETWRVGSAQQVEIAVDLGGTWKYKPIYLIPPFRGATVSVQGMKGAWPAASWIPAGRLPTTCYAMWPVGRTPKKIVTQFTGFPPHEFRVDKDAYLRLRSTSKNVPQKAAKKKKGS